MRPAFNPAAKASAETGFVRAFILRAGRSSNDRSRSDINLRRSVTINMIEGSDQVLEDYLVIAKQFEIKCVSLRPAGEHGRSVPSGLAQRGTSMVDYSAMLLKVVSRREMCLTASDVERTKSAGCGFEKSAAYNPADARSAGGRVQPHRVIVLIAGQHPQRQATFPFSQF